jgi:uncharacterized protein (TIGR02145 family)
MKAPVKLLAGVVLLYFAVPLCSQDILFSVSAVYNNQQIAVDSVTFTNLSNATRLSFTALETSDEYLFNLSTQELVEPIGVARLTRESNFTLRRSVPGEFVLDCNTDRSVTATAEVIGVNGRLHFASRLEEIAGNGPVCINTGGAGVFLIRLQSPRETRVFKAITSPADGRLEIRFELPGSATGKGLKSVLQTLENGFSVAVGDTLKVMAFREGLFTSPAITKAGENNSVLFEFTDTPPEDTTSVTDIDGNIYRIVRIGNRWWMADDLRTTRFANGDQVPDGTGAGDYRAETAPVYWFAYNDDPENVPVYGRLYTWYAASDPANICPEGWYLPSDAEWDSLAFWLGGSDVAGGKMKESGTDHWQEPNEGATNESGFNGLPAGSRSFTGGFGFLGTDAHWWTSTHKDQYNAWYRYAAHFASGLMRAAPDKRYGLSVRCIRDTGEPGTIPSVLTLGAAEITENSAVLQWQVTNNGGSAVTETGVYIGTEPDPSVSGIRVVATYNEGAISFTVPELLHSTCYYFCGYAINGAGESTGNVRNLVTTIVSEESTVTDIDGNTYRTVKLWDKWWMAENLRVTRFADGLPVALTEDPTAWSTASEPAFCWYNNDSSGYADTYGALYNWNAVEAAKLCPAGWHVPSAGEWSGLIAHLGGEEHAGGRLREIGTSHWIAPNKGATDEAGFTALPGGFRRIGGAFSGVGGYGRWWSATESEYGVDNASNTYLSYSTTTAVLRSDNKGEGYSVRCVRDTAGAGPPSYMRINDNEEYELVDGIWMNYGSNGGNFSYHALYLLSVGHDVNWETLEIEGAGAVIDFEIFTSGAGIASENYQFVQPDTFSTVRICDGTDVNGDGIVNDDDCFDIPVIPDGDYIDVTGSVYDSHANLYELTGQPFESGYTLVKQEGDIFTITFYCTGENGDVVQGVYRGTLHQYDFSDEEPEDTFRVEEALDEGYVRMTALLEISWLIDGVFCGEYASPSVYWDNIANRSINSGDKQVLELWQRAYNLVFHANKIIDSVAFSGLEALDRQMVIAEARAMRAYGYYLLLSRFGEVPIYPGTAYTQIPRSSVYDVTDLILADLMFAQSYLPLKNMALDDKHRFDQGGVKALLTKIYFLSADWTSAVGKAMEIINGAGYSADGVNRYASLGSPDNIQAYGTALQGIFGSLYNKGTVVPVSHYTEQLIIAMECEIRQGNLNLAPGIYYMLTGVENLSPSLADVYNVWMNQMSGEGVTLLTISRHGRLGEKLMIMDYRAVLPIPQLMLDTNPLMTQNIGY